MNMGLLRKEESVIRPPVKEERFGGQVSQKKAFSTQIFKILDILYFSISLSTKVLNFNRCEERASFYPYISKVLFPIINFIAI